MKWKGSCVIYDLVIKRWALPEDFCQTDWHDTCSSTLQQMVAAEKQTFEQLKSRQQKSCNQRWRKIQQKWWKNHKPFWFCSSEFLHGLQQSIYYTGKIVKFSIPTAQGCLSVNSFSKVGIIIFLSDGFSLGKKCFLKHQFCKGEMRDLSSTLPNN